MKGADAIVSAVTADRSYLQAEVRARCALTADSRAKRSPADTMRVRFSRVA
jgi:hypothetical protein